MKIFRSDQTDEVAAVLRNEGVIALPTDTVYGLCASIKSFKAMENLRKVKNRPHEKAFPVMCENEEEIRRIALVNSPAARLIKSFMPGPLTLILPKKEDVPAYVGNEQNTVAVRMACSPWLAEIIRKTGSPLFMTSANQSGAKPARNAAEIKKLCPLADGVVEGEVSYGEASTIIDATAEEIMIIRQGPLSFQAIRGILA